MIPQMLLTFTLHDGTTRSKVCPWPEAIRQLAEAKTIPSKWRDFKIEPAPRTVHCDACGGLHQAGSTCPYEV